MANTYNRKDKFYQKAKEEGYRSRAAYKLIELNKKFKLLRHGQLVLELGAWPGSWSQVALEQVGERGKVAGLDLVKMEPIEDERFLFIEGDCRDDQVIEDCIKFLGAKADLIISDMSPKLSGIPEADQAMTVACAELAIQAAAKGLKQGGDFVVKLFKGRDVEGFVKTVNRMFNKVSRVELDATRGSSNEFYMVARGLK